MSLCFYLDNHNSYEGLQFIRYTVYTLHWPLAAPNGWWQCLDSRGGVPNGNQLPPISGTSFVSGTEKKYLIHYNHPRPLNHPELTYAQCTDLVNCVPGSGSDNHACWGRVCRSNVDPICGSSCSRCTVSGTSSSGEFYSGYMWPLQGRIAESRIIPGHSRLTCQFQ